VSITHYFTLHGIPIFTSAETPALDAAACELLRAVATELRQAADTCAGITVHLSGGQPDFPPPPGARAWMVADPLCLLTDERDSYLLLDGQLLGTLSATERHITAWIPPALVNTPDFVGQMIVLPLLLEALRAYGFVSLHAAALAHNGRAALFPAVSGGGKSTLTVALLRAGFRLLSDDCPLLRHTAAGVVAHAFAEPLHISPRSVMFFPELRGSLHAGTQFAPPPESPHEHREEKVALDPVSVYGECVIQQCLPGALLFPTISQESQTRIEPLDAPDALLRLLALTMPSASRRYLRQQFELLGDLVSAVPCYTLHTGRDFERLPEYIHALLETEATTRRNL
jgi:hypothetical protein